MCLSATDWRDLERSIVVPRQQGQEILIYILITEHAQSRSYFHVGASKVFSTDVQRKDMDLGFALNRSSLLNPAVHTIHTIERHCEYVEERSNTIQIHQTWIFFLRGRKRTFVLMTVWVIITTPMDGRDWIDSFIGAWFHSYW